MKIAKKLFAQYLEPDEQIIAVFHKHPFVLMTELGKLVLFGYVLPIFLYYHLPEIVLFFVLWLCISMVRLFYMVSTWYHDSILITNVSLVDVTWDGFFKRSACRLEYQMIEGVSYEINGFIRTVFNFGNVAVKSTGGNAPITLKDAMAPQKIEREIMAHQEKFVSVQTMQDADALKSLLTTIVWNHVKEKGISG